MVDAKQNERTDERHEETRRLPWLVVPNGATDPRSEKGAGDADEHGDEDSAWLFAWNDELSERTYNKTNDCRPKQMKHRSPPLFTGEPVKIPFGAESILPVSDDEGEIGAFFFEGFKEGIFTVFGENRDF